MAFAVLVQTFAASQLRFKLHQFAQAHAKLQVMHATVHGCQANAQDQLYAVCHLPMLVALVPAKIHL